MEGNRVYVASCPGYDSVEDTLRTMLARMGGMERFVKPGERILLKVNLLRPASPETAVCTHPAVVAAVAKLVKEAGGQPVIADSPGGTALKESGLRHLYEKTGMAEAAARSGAELNYDTSTRLVSIPRGKAIRQAEVIAPAAEADGVLDLCKMKTHVLMGMTGAVKNSFGIIPGLSKVGFHGSHPRREDFADVVLDLTGFLAPRLSIMDGVLAMEGEGPGASGTPRQVGLLLASENPLALDVAAAEIMGLPRDSNPLLPAAQRRGFTPSRAEDVALIGGSWEELRIPDYRFPANVRRDLLEFLGPLAGPAKRLCKALLSQTPQIRTGRCVGCGICQRSCPGKAITLEGGKAKIHPNSCIRCYCCHELCPRKAVELKRGPLGRLLK